MILDIYGTIGIAPTDCGASTASEGNIFAEITGDTKVQTLEGDRQGYFMIHANGFPLGTRGSYNAAIDLCTELGLTPVDCTR
jgi:hypothetical protein